MSDNRRSLEDLLAAFSHTWPYHLFWDSLEKHKACRDRGADCWQGSREGAEEDDPDWKEQSLELAEHFKLESESHFKVAMEIAGRLEDIHRLVKAIDPSLLKMLPTFALNSTKPSDDTIELWAREVKALAGIIQAREHVVEKQPERMRTRKMPVAEKQPELRLISLYTNGIADDRIKKATRLLTDDTLTTSEKLDKIDALIHLPGTASAVKLGRMLGVTKQAVQQTDWWIKNRKYEKQNQIGRRRENHRERAKDYETPAQDDDE